MRSDPMTLVSSSSTEPDDSGEVCAGCSLETAAADQGSGGAWVCASLVAPKSRSKSALDSAANGCADASPTGIGSSSRLSSSKSGDAPAPRSLSASSASGDDRSIEGRGIGCVACGSKGSNIASATPDSRFSITKPASASGRDGSARADSVDAPPGRSAAGPLRSRSTRASAWKSSASLGDVPKSRSRPKSAGNSSTATASSVPGCSAEGSVSSRVAACAICAAL